MLAIMRVSRSLRLPRASRFPCALLAVLPAAAYATGTYRHDETLNMAAATIALTFHEIYLVAFTIVCGLAAFSLLAVGGAALLGRFPAQWFMSILGSVVALSFIGAVVGMFIDMEQPLTQVESATARIYDSGGEYLATAWGGSFFHGTDPSQNWGPGTAGPRPGDTGATYEDRLVQLRDHYHANRRAWDAVSADAHRVNPTQATAAAKAIQRMRNQGWRYAALSVRNDGEGNVIVSIKPFPGAPSNTPSHRFTFPITTVEH